MKIQAVLKKLAMRLPHVEEGIACAGTALESPTVTAGGKAFLFLGEKDVRLKLGDSIGEANMLAAKAPGFCEVGAHGWIKLTLSADVPLSKEVFERWIGESYRLIAPKKQTAQLTEPSRSSKTKSKKPDNKPRSR
jgi:hypothetical protein